MEEIIEEVNDTRQKLCDIWREIGLNPEECSDREQRMIEVTKDFLKTLLNEEKTMKKRLLKSIEENGREFYRMNMELGTCLPDPEENLSLIELEQYLKSQVEVLHKELKDRRSKLKDLRKQEQELCERMIEEPSSYLSNKPIPTLEDLDDLRRRVRTLELEEENRKKTFRRLKSNIIRLMDELETKANSSFEQSVLSEVEDLFTLSQQNLHHMKRINERYEQMVEDNRQECLKLNEDIRLLYNRLGEDPCQRDNFFGSIGDHRPSTLVKLRRELSRLEELKRANMAQFIAQLRTELEVWWEKCYTSEEEKLAFTPYLSDEFSEEVLQAHDSEVQRLKNYYKANEHLFLKIAKRTEVWKNLMALEERCQDSNRLFSNRGCKLLQEEKERKRIKQELPRVEKQLEELVLMWESKHGEPFLIGGKRVPDYIQMQWEQYYDQKEQEKRERQTSQTNGDSRLGPRPMKRRLARNDTTKTKLMRINENQVTGHSMGPASEGSSRRRVLQEHNRNTTARKVHSSDHPSISSNDISTYSQFSDAIQRRSERENIRSSIVHGVSKNSLLVCRPSPSRPRPPGLPKTPKTLPRAAVRRSPRFNITQSNTKSSRNLSVRQRMSPGSSPALKSPHGMSRVSTPSRWSKLSFLI